jgi:hypothetical protein
MKPVMPSSSPAVRAELTRKIVQQAQPHAIVQIGAGELESTLALCEAMRVGEGVTLTLVEPELHTDPDCRAVWDALCHHEFDTGVEMINNPADQALPDFFFQEQVYDMAVLNPSGNAEQNFVALYYLGKLLPKGAMLLVHKADIDTIKPWLRRLVTAGDYRVRRQGSAGEPPLLEKILRNRYQKLPGYVRSKIEDMIRPEVITPDSELGLNSDFVVLEKLCQGGALELDVEQMIAELV